MANIMVTLQKLANENTQKTFQYNAKEAAVSRDWQKEMSDTAHQREVKDLVAAGLNPVLSSGGSGAQSYTTSAASGVADSAVNAIGNVQSARTAAAATRYAAAQNAAAMRYAAAMQADAARYSADQHLESVKISSANTTIGAVRESLSKMGFNLGAGPAQTAIKGLKNFVNNFKNDSDFMNGLKHGQLKLNSSNKAKLFSFMRDFGFKGSGITAYNAMLLLRSIYFKDRTASAQLKRAKY